MLSRCQAGVAVAGLALAIGLARDGVAKPLDGSPPSPFGIFTSARWASGNHYERQSLRPVPNLRRLLVSVLASFLHVSYLLYRELAPKGGPRVLDALRIPPLALKHVVPAQAGVYLGGKAGGLAVSRPGLHRRVDRFLGRGV